MTSPAEIPHVQISPELLADVIDGFERVGCQFEFCNGPTLEPEDMITCFRCHTLARLRVLVGATPRLPDEGSWEERHTDYMARYMRKATGR
jgi:hypothetical protein